MLPKRIEPLVFSAKSSVPTEKLKTALDHLDCLPSLVERGFITSESQGLRIQDSGSGRSLARFPGRFVLHQSFP